MSAWWILVSVILSGPVWVVATVWSSRRLWRSARRLSARAKGQEHLIELGQVVGGLAHELKNPLSTINVNLKLLMEDLSRYRDEEHRRLAVRLQTVQLESGRIQGILDDFLRFAGKYELSLQPLDLRRIVDELVDFFTPQAEAGGIVVRSSLFTDPVVARIDADLIKQALLNLMLNAVQAMPDGGELLIRLTPEKGAAAIEVTDTGKGIASDDMDKIFDVYFSTRSGGSGLGLPTTRRIIREHGGEITVESEPGRGTRFLATIPLAE